MSKFHCFNSLQNPERHLSVLQIGYGKMGHFITDALRQNAAISSLSVCDSSIISAYEENQTRFIPSFGDGDVAKYDAAFVATPAVTHLSVMQRLIRCGMKNIYVEKPAVMNQKELDEVLAVRNGFRIVTGYILRQSETAPALKSKIHEMEKDGYFLENCTVYYQKYLPTGSEPRAMYDIGVYEEIVHVWDLLFNYFGFRHSDYRLTSKAQETDPGRADRILSTALTYVLHFPLHTATIHLYSSFCAQEKKREFRFTFRNAQGRVKTAYLAFDTPSGNDTLRIVRDDGTCEFESDYPSLLKLSHQIEQVTDYFRTGDIGDLSPIEESATIISLMQEAAPSLC